MEDRNLQIQSIIKDLGDKNFGMYFFVLDTMGNPTAGIANIYEHVKVLNDLGYRATILHEKNEYTGVGTWLGEEYMKLPHLSIESQQLKIVSADFIFIPEIFSNIMEQVKGFPCKKVVFSQNYNYIFELLPIGKRWSDFGFTDVITTSEKQATYLKTIFQRLTTHVVPVSIPSYFKPSEEIPQPIITIVTREQSDALKLVKSFYLQYPAYKWITFKELRGLSRKDFAEELKNSALGVWIDDVSGFGTFPLEAMECGTPIIGKVPNLIPEWMEESATENEVSIINNGVWTNSLLNIPDLIAEFMRRWLEDTVPTELLEGIEASKGQYTEGNQVSKIHEVYSSLVTNRIIEFQEMLELKNEGDE